jgi:hypothetical protein
MRRLSAALVAITAAIALTAFVSPTWAKPPQKSKPVSKPLVISPADVRPGQLVKVFGGGCRGITVLVLLIDSKEFHRGRPGKSGDFAYQVKLPTGLRSGEHELGAWCGRHHAGKTRFKISHRSRTSFDVSPDTVVAGDRVHADGNGCKRYATVTIKLDGKVIARFLADKFGNFDRSVRIPKSTKRGRHVVSAYCNGRFIGADGIRVKKQYDQDPDQVESDHSVVQVGHTVTLTGDNCPDRSPSASLDGTPVKLISTSNGKGFTAKAAIPHNTAPGRHKLWAGCDAGSSGTTELQVLDADSTATAADHQAFGSQQTSDLAIWAGVFAGLALLVASVGVGRRRRS